MLPTHYSFPHRLTIIIHPVCWRGWGIFGSSPVVWILFDSCVVLMIVSARWGVCSCTPRYDLLRIKHQCSSWVLSLSHPDKHTNKSSNIKQTTLFFLHFSCSAWDDSSAPPFLCKYPWLMQSLFGFHTPSQNSFSFAVQQLISWCTLCLWCLLYYFTTEYGFSL